MIGKLLGHNQVQTTARYAHLAQSPLLSGCRPDFFLNFRAAKPRNS